MAGGKGVGVARFLIDAVQKLAQLDQGAGAVAYLIFDFFSHLGERLRAALRDKKRVVTKAASAARGECDAALAMAFKQESGLALGRQRQGTSKPRRTPFGRNSL